MLDIWHIPIEILPEISDSVGNFGFTSPTAFLNVRVPIRTLICDQQAALFGNGCYERGSVKTTYGTGCFMMMNTGNMPIDSRFGLLPTAAWRFNGQTHYALDGAAYVAGAAVQWLRDGLRIIQNAAQTEDMACAVQDNADVYFVPAFSGLAAPHWDSGARGLLIGMTGGTTAEHIVRAVLESCAYQVYDLLQAMQKDSDFVLKSMKCDGGMTHNRFLMQFQADILGIELHAPSFVDITAMGTAMAAAYGTTAKLPRLHLKEHIYQPRQSETWRAEKIGRWHEAIKRSKNWI